MGYLALSIQILPIHAACINPNDDYLRALLNSVPEHSIPDKDGFKPMHYAAACEGAGPLKVLLGRSVVSHFIQA